MAADLETEKTDWALEGAPASATLTIQDNDAVAYRLYLPRVLK